MNICENPLIDTAYSAPYDIPAEQNEELFKYHLLTHLNSSSSSQKDKQLEDFKKNTVSLLISLTM